MRTSTSKMNGNPSRNVLSGNKASKRGMPSKQFKKAVTPSKIMKKERRPKFDSKAQMMLMNDDPMAKLETVNKSNPLDENRFSLPDLPTNSNLVVQGFIRTHVKHAVVVNELKRRNSKVLDCADSLERIELL